MKRLILFLLAAFSVYGQTSVGPWQHISPSSGPVPSGNGFISINYDPLAQQTLFYVLGANFTGTVNFPLGSTTVTYATGAQFGPHWPSNGNQDSIIIGGRTYKIVAGSLTGCGGVGNTCTQLSTTVACSVTCGNGVSYTAQPSSIYSTEVYAYNSGGALTSAPTNTFTLTSVANGTGSITCCNGIVNVSDSGSSTDTATSLMDRQQSRESAYDTKRNWWWQAGGINESRQITDLYYMVSHTDPTLNTWTQLLPGHNPQSAGTGAGFGFANASMSMVYDSDNDALIIWGSDGGSGNNNLYVYCRTQENPTPGTLTAKQSAVGCMQPDDWSQIPTSTGNCRNSNWSSNCAPPTTCTGAACVNTQPPGTAFPSTVYDTATKKMIAFGGGGATSTYCPQEGSSLTPVCHVTFKYDPPTKHWTQVALSTNQPPTGTGGGTTGGNPFMPAIAYVPVTHNIIYHYTDGVNGGPQDWVYNPTADTWNQISSTGGPVFPTNTVWGYAMDFDAASNKLVAWSQGNADLWVAPVSGLPSAITNLTVQEALYEGDNTGKTSVAGTGGVTRSNEPFCQGVPIADSQAITNAQTFGLVGASAGQFRTLGTWPDGNIKWVKVCGILPSLSAGSTATITLTGNSGGNFGGANLASDSNPGSPTVGAITVNTGTATFGVKKPNFNVLDSATVGSTTILASSASATRGLVMLGPEVPTAFPDNVTCSTDGSNHVGVSSKCDLVYSAANDPNSSAIIEENGPVMAVVKAWGTLYDNASHAYMHHTTRLFFYQNKNYVKVEVVLRNADYDTSAVPSPDHLGNTFDSAYKGFQSFELRLSPSISGTLNYTIATNASDNTGTIVSGTDSAYVYQAQSQSMLAQDTAALCPFNSASCANLYTPDTGFTVVKNATTLATGSATQYAKGYADISDQTGNGIEFGAYQMAAYWPKSLEFRASGGSTDVRVGIFPVQNSIPEYQPWPAWYVSEMFLEFHTSTPSSIANDFYSYQAPLLVRPASVAYINATNVFPFPIPDPSIEDQYYGCLQNGTACPSGAGQASPALQGGSLCFGGTCSPAAPDRGVTSRLTSQAKDIAQYRTFSWGTSGTLNQEEFRWSDLQTFLRRGFTGGYLNSLHFYRFQSEKAWPHADGTSSTDSAINHFTWRSRPQATQANAELDNVGMPSIAHGGGSTAFLNNSTKAIMNSWGGQDIIHFHWYGQPDFYMLTGDELIHEAMMPQKDFYLNPNTYQNENFGGLGIARGYGIQMMGAAAFGLGLNSMAFAAPGQTIPDTTDGANVITNGVTTYNARVKAQGCVSGFPVGCTPSQTAYGTSYTRGISLGSTGKGFCPADFGSTFIRISQPFETSIEIKGILWLRFGKGTTWTEYENSLDLAYGLAVADLGAEHFWDDGTVRWKGADARYNGFRFEIPIDSTSRCPSTIPLNGGTATVSGTAVTIVSGLTADSTWCATPSGGGCTGTDARQFSINGFVSSVVHVTDANHITINANTMGTISSPTIFQIDGPGTASASGTAITGLSGPLFDSTWIGQPFGFASTGSTAVASVTDGTHLTTVAPGLGTVALANYRVGSTYSDVLYKLSDGTIWDSQTFGSGGQSIAANFYALYLENGTVDWQRKLNIAIARAANGASPFAIDIGGAELGMLIATLSNPGNLALQDISYTSTDLGSGNYRLTFTPPSGTTALRIKWSPNTIANSGGPSTISPNCGGLLGYDNVAQTFASACPPSSTTAWPFANTTVEPAPTPGVSQNFTVSTANVGSCGAGGCLGLTVPNFSVKAMSPTSCAITTTSLPAGTVGIAYSQTISQGGCGAGPFTWSLTSGSLPPGLGTIGASTGLISGTPTTVGTYNFTVKVTDGGSNTATKALSITIISTCTINTASLPGGTVGNAYSQTIATSNCVAPMTWALISGPLPPGLTLGSSTGTISGTPTTAGTYPIKVSVTDAANAQPTQNLSITISGGCQAPQIQTTSPIPNGGLGIAYSFAFQATNNPTSWTATNLPSWASFDTVAAVLSGTPNAIGTTVVQVTATNACGSDGPSPFSLTISNTGSVMGGTAVINGTGVLR